MPAVFSGENRRAAVISAVGLPAIIAMLVFRLLSGGDTDATATPVVSFVAAPAPPAGATARPVPAPSLPVDAASLRDPFCPLVVAAVAPGSPPAECAPRSVAPGRQTVGLEDIFVEGDVRLARIHIDLSTFPNLHEGDALAGGFRVLALAERCGEFEIAGSPFSLCIGEQALR
jgi:hypothetical protein